jgi:hypothetical protein
MTKDDVLYEMLGLCNGIPCENCPFEHPINHDMCRFRIKVQEILNKIFGKINPLTDSEKNLFLVAMSKEKQIRKQVEEEYFPGEFDLVDDCDSIVEKVKGALWE